MRIPFSVVAAFAISMCLLFGATQLLAQEEDAAKVRNL